MIEPCEASMQFTTCHNIYPKKCLAFLDAYHGTKMEEKKERTIEEMSIYERIGYVRVEVQRRAKKKSGKGMNGSSYFQQKDFLPIANEVFAKYKLLPLFNISGYYEGDKYIEEATLTVYDSLDPNKATIWCTPTANANMPNPIQALGAKHSYLKRYLYLNALELAEYDMVEQKAVAEQSTNPYGTSSRQVEELKKYYSQQEIAALCKTYGVQNPINLRVDIVESYISQGRKRSGN